MEGLGRNFQALKNVAAGTVRVDLEHASALSIVLTTIAANAVTLQQHSVASGGTPENLLIDHFYEQSSGLWTKTDVDPAANTFTPAGTEDLIVVEIDSKALNDGFKYVSATGTGITFLYLLNDLVVQRDPTSLIDPSDGTA